MFDHSTPSRGLLTEDVNKRRQRLDQPMGPGQIQSGGERQRVAMRGGAGAPQLPALRGAERRGVRAAPPAAAGRRRPRARVGASARRARRIQGDRLRRQGGLFAFCEKIADPLKKESFTTGGSINCPQKVAKIPPMLGEGLAMRFDLHGEGSKDLCINILAEPMDQKGTAHWAEPSGGLVFEPRAEAEAMGLELLCKAQSNGSRQSFVLVRVCVSRVFQSSLF